MSNDRFSRDACLDIAEKMGLNLGNAFVYMWRSGFETPLENLKLALEFLNRAYRETAPWPQINGHAFREHMKDRRSVFNRPSPWCECVRHAMAALCDLAASPEIRESERLVRRAIRCIETALDDEQCDGRGMEP